MASASAARAISHRSWLPVSAVLTTATCGAIYLSARSNQTLECSGNDTSASTQLFHTQRVTITKVNSIPRSPPPSHHVQGGFRNPWPSFVQKEFSDFFPAMLKVFWAWPKPPVLENRVEVVTPDNDGLRSFLNSMDYGKNAPATGSRKKMAITWLGHAAMMATTPAPNSFNVLFDPCWTDRCSPSQYFGPSRITKPPCGLDELPEINAVVISHSHYDHLSTETVLSLSKRFPDCYFFAPLGNKKWFEERGVKNVVELDWWEAVEMVVRDAEGKVTGRSTIVCTPCQHFAGRTLFDRNETLWSSWALVTDKTAFWFGGDTGYRSVPEKEPADLSTLPHCPVFKEIGARYGPFDAAAIPIGAYSPRVLMSPVHCNPVDAVDVHCDIRSKKSVGMHFGTWMLTNEDPSEPPRLLKTAMKEKGLNENEFVTIKIGETIYV